jgi:2',3'-cyclic-nucleotide 2'-phosphodiesterase / 3'-nucleotidase / 5'-nucleotidase
MPCISIPEKLFHNSHPPSTIHKFDPSSFSSVKDQTKKQTFKTESSRQKMSMIKFATLLLALQLMIPSSVSFGGNTTIRLERISTFEPLENEFDESVAEINAYDSARQRLYVTNGFANRLDVWNLANPATPVQLASLELSSFGGGGVTSAAIYQDWLAIVVKNTVPQDPGTAIIYNLAQVDPLLDPTNTAAVITVGAIPDMVTFTRDGKFALVANEGEPDDEYNVDPVGSISIIQMFAGDNQFQVRTAGFESFNSAKDDLIASGVRIFGPGATVAQDLEPEYITVSPDSKTAYVSLQENNAIAIVDIWKAQVLDIKPLGYKNHNASGNALDASDDDGAINIQNWPVYGMYQPDGLAAYSFKGATYIVTANEGDARDYEGLEEETRVEDETLDPTVFPNAVTLKLVENLGRLTITNTLGDIENDGDFEALYAFGARSISILDANANIVWDSGSQLEDIVAERFPLLFNTNNDQVIPEDGFDTRSDNKGPEPEGVVVGVIDGKTYAFIGLERVGGIMVYDVSIPTAPKFVDYVRTEGDLGPEGLSFVAPYLFVSNEVSGTTTMYRVTSV